MNHIKNVVTTGRIASGSLKWSQNLNVNFTPSKMRVTRVSVVSNIGIDTPNIFAIYMSSVTDPIAEVILDGTAYFAGANDVIWISGPLDTTASFSMIGQNGTPILGSNTSATITIHLSFE